MEIKITRKANHLEVLASGIYSQDVINEYFSRILSESRASGISFVLVDIRQVTEMKDINRFHYAVDTHVLYESYLKSGGKPIRFAYFGSIDQVKGFQPGYDYASRRELPVLLTEDYEKAIKWFSDDSI